MRNGERRRAVVNRPANTAMWHPNAALPLATQSYRMKNLKPGVWHVPREVALTKDAVVTQCGRVIHRHSIEQSHAVGDLSLGLPTGHRLCRRCVPQP